MRILKRNLAFMLALVMALGLMTTASAANVKDYKDANDVTYVEAVDVLTALKVLDGTDGSFNPTDTLTREQGAKIIAYVMLGADAAKALSTSVAPFKDVAANRWSAGFIAYCVSQNIIGGYGDGNFGPEDTLTANQFAKMLLCAVGYNVNGEFTGSNWEIEVSKTALTEGVFDGNLGANFSAGVKREEAALYAFNTLTSVMTVSYSDVFGTYYSGKLFNNESKFNNEYTLGYKLYNLESKDSTDDFDRDCHYWVKKSAKLTGDYHDAADATYTAAVKSGTLYSDLGLTKTVDATVIRNGGTPTTFQIKKGLTSKDIGGNGILVEAYADDDENVTLILIDTYLAKVTDVDDGKVYVDPLYGSPTITNKYFETSVAFEKNDYVLITVAENAIQSMKASTLEKGVVSINATSYITLDGTKLNKSQMLKSIGTTVNEKYFDIDFDAPESTAILDQYGYVIGVVITEAADADYNYVLVKASQGQKDSLISGKAAVVEVVYLDGKSEVLPLETRKNTDGDAQYKLDGNWVTINDNNGLKTWTGADNTGDYSNPIEGWYRYSINDNGQIVLKALKTSSNKYSEAAGGFKTTITFTKGNQLLDDNKFAVGFSGDSAFPDGLFANSSTVYHEVTKDSVKTTTGYKNIGISATNANVLLVFSGKVITDIYVVNSTVSKDPTYAYYNGTNYTTSKGTYVTMYVDGSAVNYLYDESKLDPDENDDKGVAKRGNGKVDLAKGIYTIEVSNSEISSWSSKGAATNDKIVRVTDTAVSYFSGKIVSNDADSGKLYYADDVKVYDVTDDGAEAVISSGDYVVYCADGSFTTHAYIIAAPDTTTSDPTKPTTNYTVTPSGKTATALTLTVGNIKVDDKIVVRVDRLTAGEYGEFVTEPQVTAVGTSYAYNFTYTLTGDSTMRFTVSVNGETVGVYGPYNFNK